MRAAVDAESAPPALRNVFVVTSGRRRIGSSTIAYQLAQTLAMDDKEVTLLDGDLERAGATRLACGHDPPTKVLADVCAGTLTLAEVLRPVRNGLQIAPSAKLAADIHVARGGARRIVAAVAQMARNQTAVVVDLAPGLSPWNLAWWQLASTVCVVTTPDDGALVDTYAVVKQAAASDLVAKVRLVANRCKSSHDADCAHQRIGQTCFRFLGELLPTPLALPECDGKPERDEHFQGAVAGLALQLGAARASELQAA